jgi:hypothetical protein
MERTQPENFLPKREEVIEDSIMRSFIIVLFTEYY